MKNEGRQMDLELTEVVRASVQNQDIDFYNPPGQKLKEAEAESPSELYLLALPPLSRQKILFCPSICPAISPRVQGNKCKPKYS